MEFGLPDQILSGTAGATTAVVTGGPATYNVAVSGMTADGTVNASIGAGVASDLAGNPNLASTSTDNTVTYNQPNIMPSTITVEKVVTTQFDSTRPHDDAVDDGSEWDIYLDGVGHHHGWWLHQPAGPCWRPAKNSERIKGGAAADTGPYSPNHTCRNHTYGNNDTDPDADEVDDSEIVITMDPDEVVTCTFQNVSLDS